MSREVQVRFCESRAVRFHPATHLLVCCRSEGQAKAALARLTALLADLGLRPKPAKTRIVHLVEGGPGFDFLGFHHRLVRSRPRRRGTGGFTFLARWPSRQAAAHARDRIRFMTMRARLAAPVEQVVQDINIFLRGWVGFFRYGNSADEFDKIRKYAEMPPRLVRGEAAQTRPGLGICPALPVAGCVRTDQPQWSHRRPQAEPALAGSGRTPPVKDVGEPCAGEPHARFDGRGLETERESVTAPVPDPTNLLWD